MRGLWIVLASFFFSSAGYSWKYPTFDFCAEHTRISYLHDVDNKESVQEILPKLRQAEFKKSPLTIHYGYTHGTVWLYLKVQQEKEWQKCILQLANPQLDHIEIFQIINGQAPESIAVMGDHLPFSERYYRTRDYVFPFHADQDQEFLLALQSNATMTVPIKVQWRDEFINASSFDYLILGFFYGLMVFFIFFGLHSFVSLRNKSYLLYTLFAFSMLLFFMDRDGITFQYFWPNAVAFTQRSVRVFAALSMALGVLYFAFILRIEDLKLRWISFVYAGFCVISIAMLFWFPPAVTNKATVMIAAGTPILMIILSWSSLKKERLFAPYMLAAALCSFVGFVVYSLSVTNQIPANFFTDNAMKLSTMVEFGFLSLAMHRKIRFSQKKEALHKAVFEISNMLAHDVRKPLDKMDKFLRRLERLPEDQAMQYLQGSSASIKEDIQVADKMLSDLTEMGKESNGPSETDLSLLITKACNGRYKYSLGYKGTVKVNEVSLKRVFDNITLNAQQATSGKPNCQYWIETKEEKRFVKIAIGNTGSKIEKEDLPKIFGLFFTKGKKKGSGIGLAYVEQTIRKNGGKISVESNGWSSSGKQVQPKYSIDYVEFHMTLPKGEKNA